MARGLLQTHPNLLEWSVQEGLGGLSPGAGALCLLTGIVWHKERCWKAGMDPGLRGQCPKATELQLLVDLGQKAESTKHSGCLRTADNTWLNPVPWASLEFHGFCCSLAVRSWWLGRCWREVKFLAALCTARRAPRAACRA